MKLWGFLTRPANLPIFNAKFFFVVGSSTLFFYCYYFYDVSGFLNIIKQFLKVFVFNFSFFYLLWYGAGFFGEKALRAFSNVCLTLALIFGCVEIFTLYSFSTLFNQVFAGVVLGTNWNESKEFLSMYLNAEILALVGVFLALGIICAFVKRSIMLPRVLYVICALFSVGILSLIGMRAEKNPLLVICERAQIPRILKTCFDGALYQIQILKEYKNLNESIQLLANFKALEGGGQYNTLCFYK